jgi:hypothetical protein
MRPFFENNVLQQQPFKPMIIVVDTTKAGSASNTFVLPIIKDTTETVKIYWGDGTNSTGVNGNNTHVYAAGGVYTVKIESRLFGGIYFNNLGDKAKITKIASYGQGVSRLNMGSFYGCSSLLSIDIGNIMSNGADASNQYRGCTALTTVPLLNLSSVTNAYAMFAYLYNITTVPLFNLSNCTSTRSMFYQCTALTTVPLFNVSSVTDAYAMFAYCAALTTVPLFNLSNCTSTQLMFAYCAALTTVPLFDLSKVTNAANMFTGVTLTTQSYSDFLINLATLPLQSGVSFHGGNSKYNPAAATARAYLISNFGWTITDGGAA